MRRLSTILAMTAVTILPGCLTVHPLVPVVTTAAQFVYEKSQVRPDGPISVEQLLAGASGIKASLKSDLSPFSLTLHDKGLSEQQRREAANLSRLYVDQGVSEVEIVTGSALSSRNLNNVFFTIHEGRNLLKLFSNAGLKSRVRVDPNRPAGQIMITPHTKTMRSDA